MITVKPPSSVAQDLAKDAGYNDRKFWLTLIAMALIVVVGIVAGFSWASGLGANLPTVVGGIIGALGIFAGANVMVKQAAARAAGPAKPKTAKVSKK